jgi:putative ABC transport system permease protein
VAASTAPRRFNLILVEVFAAAALLLAALGVYSLTAFNIRQRRRELSIRLALGAQAPALVRLSVRDAMRPTLVGLALGIAGALLAGRLAAGLLVGVTPSDPATLIIASAMLCATAAFAAWLPARSAAGIDPQLALRAE